MTKYEMIATTLMGLEDVLAKEIKHLGGEKVEVLKRAVRFYGDDTLLYKSNLALRTALKILVPIDEFTAEDEESLYKQVRSFSWEDIFSTSQTFAIDAVVSGNNFKHSKYVALKTKDAIADRFRNKFGVRPSVDTKEPDIYLNLHVSGSNVSVSINSSGVSLDKRGYRTVSNHAPINEALAAGIILITGWKPTQTFIDPMSGSGTFGIEAAMIGTNKPPGLHRSFSFQRWLEFDPELFETAKQELTQMIVDEPLKIYCRDLSSRNIELISQNASKADVEDYLMLKKEDFFESIPKSEEGVMVLNPPYGERLKLDDIESFYAKIGDTLKQKYTNYDVWVISSDATALKSVGLKATVKIDLMNGGLNARLVKFEIYKGSKRETEE